MIKFRQFLDEALANKAQTKAVKGYSGADAYSLNHYRNQPFKEKLKLSGHRRGKSRGHPGRNKERLLSKAIRSHKTEHDMTVYHGVPHAARHAIAHAAAKGVYHNKGYMSTSKDHKTAKGFGSLDDNRGRHVLKIHVPKGSHALDLHHHGVGNRNEQEVLFHRNTRIHIHKVEKTRDFPNRPEHTHPEHTITYHGTLVHDGTRHGT